MTSLFESLVRARRENAPWARISLVAFMTEMIMNEAVEGVSEVTLSVQYRHEVASRRWWTISWVGEDGKRHEESAQELDLCMWRAVEREIQVREEIERKEKENSSTPKGEGSIEAAGVEWREVGKGGRFRHRVQRPWAFTFKDQQDPEIITSLLNKNKFTVIEKIVMDGLTTAHIVDGKTGEGFDLQLNGKTMLVYPKSNNHYDASIQLWDLFDGLNEGGK